MAASIDQLHPPTGYLIWRLSLRWRVAVDRALAPLGLTHAQYALLAPLYGLSQSGAPPSQQELADFSGIEPMYVSKLVRVAERDGLVERSTNATDPRAVALTLTSRGIETVIEAMARVRVLHEQLLAPLGEPGDPRRVQLTEALRMLLRQAKMLESTPSGQAHRGNAMAEADSRTED